MGLPRLLVISNYSAPLNSIRPEAEIFLGLLNMGFEVTVMTEAGSHYANRVQEEGGQIISYRAKNKFDRKAIRLIKQAVKERDIDIVHAFNGKSIANASWALIGKPQKLIGYRGYTGNVHWYDPSNYINFLNPRLDHMICLAESVREMFLANGKSPDWAVTINKGHHASWYDGVEAADLGEFNLPADAMVCSFVANKRVKMKGVKFLIEATHLLPPDLPIYILMIGKGQDTDEVKQWIADSPYHDRIIFTGFRDDVSAVVKACDVAISVSLFGEATQKAMIEAMYLERPVIISDISGNRGMAVDGKTGYVVPPGNAQAIADSLLKMWEHPEQRTVMGKASREHIQGFLSQERTVKEYAAFYQRIM